MKLTEEEQDKKIEKRIKAMAPYNRAGARFAAAASKIRKKEIAVWRVARKAPMFMKKTYEMKTVKTANMGTKREKTGKVLFKRSQRLIGSQAYNVMMAGAGAYVGSVTRRRAALFREKVKDEGRVPFVPTISPGAAAALEQMLCAYTQEAVYNAMMIRDNLDKSTDKKKRLNTRMVQIGFQTANSSVFGGASLAPRSVGYAEPVKKAPKGEKPAKDDD